MKMAFIGSPYRGDIEANVVKPHRYCLFATKNEVVL